MFKSILEKIPKYVKRTVAVVLCIVLFCLSAVPAVLVSRYFSDESITKTQARFKWFYEQEKNSLDVVYLGSSAVYKYDINVQNWNEYGFTSAGLCSAAQPFETTKYLMEETLKTQSPQLFVVDMRQFVRTAAAEATGDAIYIDNKFETYYSSLFSSLKHSYTRWKMINAVIEDDAEALSWNFEFLRHHNKWQDFEDAGEMVEKLMDKEEYEETSAINGVSVTSYLSDKPLKLKNYAKMTEKLPVPDSYKETLDDLVDYIKTNKINVLFISTPSRAKKSHREVQNWLKEYFNDNDLEYVDYLDHWDEIGLDPNTDFSDTLHVNVAGAEKWTHYIGGDISKRIKKTEHSSEVKKSWDEAYENWLPVRDQLMKELDVRIKKNRRM